jgi:F-type H+-transporting ATPase subunit gamma
MANLKELRGRIKSVASIAQITRAMEMVASMKLRKVQAKAQSFHPYVDEIRHMIEALAGKVGGDGEVPLFQAREVNTVGVLVITSDRGLCGPYNGSILRTTMQHFAKAGVRPPAGLLELIGKKGAGFMRYNGTPVARQHTQFGDKPSFDNVAALAQDYMDRFTSGKIKAVRVIYMKFHSPGKQSPEVLQLLPLKPIAKSKPAAEAGKVDAGVVYEFSPKAEELLGDLLPATVKATLFQCFNDAIVSEHVARMVAMKAATDNAGKMRKLYTRDYNRARQAQITTELSEIIAGAAALG